MQASYSLLNKVDHVLDAFIRKFEKHLNNTVMLLISDHGVHFGQLAHTSLVHVRSCVTVVVVVVVVVVVAVFVVAVCFIKVMPLHFIFTLCFLLSVLLPTSDFFFYQLQEHKNPPLFFSMPSWLLSQHPQLYRRFHDLQTRLVTPLDLYHTLKHLPYFPHLPPAVYTDKPISSISFIGDTVLQKDRSCAEALIPSYACGCYTWGEVPKEKVAELIKIPIGQMNEHINSSSAVCKKIELQSVITAQQTSEKEEIMYTIEFTAVPPAIRASDPPLFRAFLTHRLATNYVNLDYVIQVSEFAKHYTDKCSKGIKNHMYSQFCLCTV